MVKLQKQQKQEIAELEEKRAEYQTAEANYRTTIDQKKGEVQNFDKLLASAQALAAEYQDTINAQNIIIAQEKEREERERREREEQERRERERQEELECIRRQEEQQRAQAAVIADNGSSGSTSQSDGTVQDTSSGGGGASGSGGGESEAPADTGDKNPGYSTGVSGSDVVAYAMNFVGNPYVWGGKDPNTGADCSGFTSYVYAHFGISIPSYSYSQRSVGQEVSYANAQPGDLICYAGHVAIYMGNGQIVHAKGTAYGIVAYDNATYRSIITVRRVL